MSCLCERAGHGVRVRVGVDLQLGMFVLNAQAYGDAPASPCTRLADAHSGPGTPKYPARAWQSTRREELGREAVLFGHVRISPCVGQ